MLNRPCLKDTKSWASAMADGRESPVRGEEAVRVVGTLCSDLSKLSGVGGTCTAGS